MITGIQTTEQRLGRNKILAKRLDVATAACMVALPLVTFSFGMAHLWDDEGPMWVKVAGAFIAGMIVAYPGIKVIGAIGSRLMDKYAPTWIEKQ